MVYVANVESLEGTIAYLENEKNPLLYSNHPAMIKSLEETFGQLKTEKLSLQTKVKSLSETIEMITKKVLAIHDKHGSNVVQWERHPPSSLQHWTGCPPQRYR